MKRNRLVIFTLAVGAAALVAVTLAVPGGATKLSATRLKARSA